MQGELSRLRPGPSSSDPHAAALSFDERLGLLVDSQYLAVHSKRIQRALREAKLRISSASLQALDCPEKRHPERAQLAQLASGHYIEQHLSVLITGATGTGKTFLACAWGSRGLHPELPRAVTASAAPAAGAGPGARRRNLRPCAGSTAADRFIDPG